MNVLLVCASPAAPDPEWVAELAAQEDVVIAVDGGGNLCLRAGIVPHTLIGDLDSITPADKIALEMAGTQLVQLPADKDESDLVLALNQARSMGAKRATVTGGWGGRADHELLGLSALVHGADLRPRLLERATAIWILTPGGRENLHLCGTGSIISLVAFGGPATVSVTGVKWPLAEHEIAPDSTLGLSNVINQADTACVSVQSGTLIVISSAIDGQGRATEE
ncbi:MAG: thiamine diphosphokinase [Coriobacteriia bacterium]|nr:thiamine diphosphokinase [Coriobacteriia bacterium]